MTDRKKFEAMLEALINEDHEAAKDIFHNIVVAKSREIYENLLAEEFAAADDEEFEEAFGDDAEDDSEEDDSEESDDAEDDGEFGGFGDDDAEDDGEFGDEEGDEEGDDEFGADDEFGDEEGGSLADLQDEVFDLKDSLEDLRAEFEQLMAGEEGEPEHADMFGGDDEFGMGDDELGMGDEEEVDEFQSMFEYVNKVALPKHGDNGINNKSIFNKPKYNDMGGVAPKFGGTATSEGTKGGLLKPTTSKMDGGNQNVPGNAKAPKLKPVPKGHGAEKRSSGDNGTNKRSLIPGRK